MTTADQDAAAMAAPLDGVEVPVVDAFETMKAAMASLPDVSVMAQMANEMFKAIPGLSATGAQAAAAPSWAAPSGMPAGGMPLAMPGLGAASGLQAPVLPGFPTEADLRGLASLATGGLAATPTTPQSPGLPWLPGEADMRQLASLATTPTMPKTPGLPWLPGEADVRELASLSTGGLATTPAVPGSMPTSFDPASMLTTPSFYFLEDAQAFAMGETPRPPAQPFTRAATPTSSPRIESSEIRPEIVPSLAEARGIFDPSAVRRDFPILGERVHGRPLIWLDNAATTQKPRAVIDRISRFYEHENSNIHRAAHTLAARSTDAYEAARETTRRFLGAGSTREIVFVRGATEGINLVSQSWGRRYVGEGDEIILTRLEHHSNIVPWQLLCAEKGARLRVAPVDDSGQILLDEYERLFGPKTRLVSLAHVSNALGTVLPVREMTEIAHRHGARVLVDGAQSVSHMAVDVQAIDCDWFVFSGHKVFGPTGIGAVYGKQEVLDATPPWQGGGNMITDVTFEKTTYQPAPMRFEAGTGNIADAVGLGAALEYLMGVGLENVSRHEHDLLVYATKEMLRVPGLHIIGTAPDKAGVLSFVLDGFRTEDVGKALDSEGIAVRSGHHCAQPALRRFGLESTVRPSLALYNTCEDVDALVAALSRLQSGRGLRAS